MSLINQMLKDLDARKQQGASHAAQEAEIVVCHPPQRSRFRTVAVLVAVTSLCVGGWWWFSSQATVVIPPASLQTQQQQKVESVALIEAVPSTETVVAPVEFSAAQQLSEPVVVPVLAKSSGSPLNVAVVNLPVERLSEADAEGELQLSAVNLTARPSIPSARLVIEPPNLAEQAQQLRREGRAFIHQQQYHSGAQLLNQALELDHGSAQQWQELVRACVQAGDLSSAMDAVIRGCEAYSNDVGLRVYRARLIVETGDYHSALTVLQTGATPSVGASSDYYALLASVLQQLSQFTEAAAQYALLTTTYPQRGDWWIGRAVCADQLGLAQHAITYYQQAIRCQQLNPQLKQFAVQQLTRLGKG
ncbi:MAG: hypothetical protein B6I37_04730 [Desulfobacteraceae bacterium 4572_35.2]|nr:MAG: hypothetical protein B6I37_04730 [Desulfobacteraceae bacterium 4572_35.2]